MKDTFFLIPPLQENNATLVLLHLCYSQSTLYGATKLSRYHRLDARGDRRYSSTHSRHWIGVSGQRHAQAGFYPREITTSTYWIGG
jgi:hypothetical protein